MAVDKRIYPFDLESVDAITTFLGEEASGTWLLSVGDAGPLRSGRLDWWRLKVRCAP